MRRILIITLLLTFHFAISYAQVDKTKWTGSVKADSYYTYNPFGEIGCLYLPFSRAYIDSVLSQIVLAEKVGIGTTDPVSELEVNGTATMTGFKLTTAPSNGYVLTSDASGNGSWALSTSGGSSGLWQQEVVNNADND